jgi:hypothetical protein
LTGFLETVKAAAETIKVSAEAVSAVAKALDEFDRSAIVEINNTSTRTLTLAATNHDHGGFRDLPPESVPPGSSRLFSSASSGIAVGTTGQVQYRLDDGGTIFRLGWIIPFIGGNESTVNVGDINSDFYVVDSLTGGGNTAHIRYLLGEKAAAAPRQPDWQTCRKCKSMFFAPQGADSSCAASGNHEPAGFNFNLPHDIAGPGRQADWRTCSKCKTMFFNGHPDLKGVCPAQSPPSHEAAGIGFDLPANGPGDSLPHQDQWRFCVRCFALFFGPQMSDSDCPAGGLHAPSDFNYFLPLNRPEDAVHQSQWQTCGKCKAMFFVPHGIDSDCAAGGTHEPAGFVFQLPHDNPGPGRESGWRTCGQCKTMFWNGDPNRRGVCAGKTRPSHEAAGIVFHLPHDMPGTGQDNWKFCTRCFGLVFEPHNADSDCPAGGIHTPQGFNFRLDHT